MVWYVGAGLGCAGSVIRSLIGLRKSVMEKRRIVWGYFVWSLVEGAIVGGLIGAFIGETHPLMIVLAGAGGATLLDNGQKILKIQPLRIGK